MPIENELIFEPIESLDLSTRAFNVTQNLGVTYIGDLIQLNVRDIKNSRSCGAKTLKELRECLEFLDLSFGSRIYGWNPARRKGLLVPKARISLCEARKHLEDAVTRLRGYGNDSLESRALQYVKLTIHLLEQVED